MQSLTIDPEKQRNLKNNITLQDEFIEVYLQVFNLSETCRLLNISRNTYYEALESNPDFKEKWNTTILRAYSDVEPIICEYLHSTDSKLVMWAIEKLTNSKKLKKVWELYNETGSIIEPNSTQDSNITIE